MIATAGSRHEWRINLISKPAITAHVLCTRKMEVELTIEETKFRPSLGGLAMETIRHSSTFLLPPIPNSTAASPSQINPNYALVVLNQSIPRFTPLLWTHARLRIFADGGGNRIYDEMPLLFPQEVPLNIRRRYKPDVIKGDMDSIRKEVHDFYLNMGTRIMDDSHDQDTTDLHKCISYINECTCDQDKPHLCILVAGALGGRFDHEAANINILYKFSDLRINLLSDDCLILLLTKNQNHEIHIQSSVEGPHCGLIPVGAPSTTTTTTGLQWNLTDRRMEFGGLISTCNVVRDDIVTVRSDSDLLWTISLKKIA